MVDLRIPDMGDTQDARRDDGKSVNSGRDDPEPDHGAFVAMDAMRGALAIIVAFAHAWYLLIEDYSGQTSVLAAAAYFLAGYAHASVILFFVLSGYWITRSVERRVVVGWRWPNYLIDRLARLLVVLLPALAIGGVLDAIALVGIESTTHSGATDTYVLRRNVGDALSWRVLLGNIFFLQGIVVAPFGTNGPLWSLAYEFWFYIWFPAIIVSWRTRRISPFLLAIGLAWIVPHMVIGFGCWLCGAALYRATRARTDEDRRPPLRGIWLSVASAALILMLIAVRIIGLAYLELALAATFALFLYVLLLVDPPAPRWLQPLAAYGAQASFSLYALHFPVIAFAAAMLLSSERMPPTAANILLMGGALALAIVVCWVFARFTERHTGTVRSFLTSRLLASRSPRVE
ncbi:acyltransferase [Sphingomonas sp. 1P06PA]|uniref:acyltransferase family protein n=1 Tax=Sphingomonas sp. 1P06PA TaxID=554121 RepID=UPI0039A5943B